MTDHPTPPPIPPPRMPATTARRALAASMLQAADRAVAWALVADTLDATAAAVLRVAAVEDETAGPERAIHSERRSPSSSGDDEQS